MKFTPIPVTATVVGIFAATLGVAQTPSPPASTTNPNSASRPSQRETTHSSAAETSAPSSPDPAGASTPHQRQAMGGKGQTMQQCMDAQAAKNSGMSRSDMTKTCNQQMKMQKDHEHLSQAPTRQNDSDSTRTPTPK
jgi:hypothetical protein